jgi:catechol 2,3-dioxygenase-like lactoylglutathione lyase family enzyme
MKGAGGSSWRWSCAVSLPGVIVLALPYSGAHWCSAGARIGVGMRAAHSGWGQLRLSVAKGSARGEAGSAVYTIEVEDIRTAFETLKSRGVRFEPSEVLEFPWGSAARFQDPDGNLLQVREGKGEFRL